MADQDLGRGKTCFIVSPIGDALAPLGSPGRSNYEQSIMMWSKVFEPACNVFGLSVVRADKIADPGEIPEQIFKYLRDADVVVADLSNANPNVMYELGLRHSRHAITLQVGEYERLPFDITTIRTIQFVRDEAGLIGVRDQLIESLRAALSTGPTDLRATAVFTGGSVASGNLDDDVRRSAQPEEDVVAEEPGIVELLAEGEQAIEHVATVLGSATEQIQEISRLATSAGEEISTPSNQSRGFAGRLQITRRLASDLLQPAQILETTATEFSTDISSIDALVQHVIARVSNGEEDSEEIRQFLTNILQLVDAAEQSAIGITGMRDGVRSLRRLSSSLADPSRAIERGLDRFLEGIRNMQAWREPIQALEAELV